MKNRWNVFFLWVVLVSLNLPLWSEESAPSTNVPQSQQQMLLSFAPIVEKVAPAVVNIYATRVLHSQNYSPFYSDPLFRHFFGDNFSFGEPSARVQSSLGSGVIVKDNGVVVTNFHVIKDAAEIKVLMMDGQEFDADIVVKDKRTDLAVLKIKTGEKKLPYLEFRDADTLKVGDLVLAIGNPFGFGQTVTSGIVSGLARTQMGVSDFRSLIQTDAAVNPGNSGGPLVTMDGKVVGINTAIFSNNGGSIGIGFAIPSNLVLPVVAAIEHGGKIIRPWAGISMDTITPEIAQALGLEKVEGVLAKRIFEKSPADVAGVKKGDVVLRIGGHPARNEAALRFRIATLKVGDRVILDLWRDGEIKTVTMEMKEPPDIPGNRKLNLTGRHPLAGAVVTGLSPAVANDLGVAYETGGVVIISIRSGTSAALTGLLPGDIVMAVNGAKVNTVEELARNLGRSRSGWEIDFIRRGREQKIVVRNW